GRGAMEAERRPRAARDLRGVVGRHLRVYRGVGATRRLPQSSFSLLLVRGGHVYPSRIRKEAPRPLRVFLQDGEADLDNQYGNWWLANLEMVAALKYQIGRAACRE